MAGSAGIKPLGGLQYPWKFSNLHMSKCLGANHHITHQRLDDPTKCQNATTVHHHQGQRMASGRSMMSLERRARYVIFFFYFFSFKVTNIIYNRLLRSQSCVQNAYPTLTARKRAQTMVNHRLSPRYELYDLIIIIYLIYLIFYS